MRLQALLGRLRSEGTPLIDGDTATFVWQGETAPKLIDDLHNWDEAPQEMTRRGKGLWTLSLELPRDGYLEYAFVDGRDGVQLLDPLNPRRVWNGVNAYNNYFYMPEGRPTPLIRPGKDIARGTVTRHQVPTRDFALGANRSVSLYRPPVEGPVPLLFVYDGTDYLRRGRLNLIVDNLIAHKRIRPVAMALVQNGGPARTLEYSCSESTLGFLMECVLPLARQHLDLEPIQDSRYGLLGASLGGLMALYTAVRLPQVFRKVLSQSGAFIVPDHQFVVVDLVRCLPYPDIEVWMDAGRFEPLLDGNRQMHALLQENGYPVAYHEFSGGHNYTSWRDDVGHGLEALYG